MSDLSEPTPEMIKAGEEAYRRKQRDMTSPTPTEEPGIGPIGYAYLAMRAKLKETDGIRGHVQTIQKLANDVAARCNLAAFLEALDEWGCDDNEERAKAIIDFQNSGCDLSGYIEKGTANE